MIDIWKILQIEPTTDRKIIRRAYAARSKETHPEEKPEEFRMLYEAYQAALTYAKRGGQSASFLAEEEIEEAHAEHKQEKKEKAKEESDEPLLSYFEKNIEKRRKHVQMFCKHFLTFSRERRTPEQKEWWAEYLYTKEFQEIKWHPDVVNLLVEELEKRFTFEKDFKLLLWDAYHFQKDESEYSTEIQKLFRILYAEYEMKVMIDGFRIQQQESKKRWKRIFLIAGILLLILTPIWIYYQSTKEARFAASYLRNTYPGVEFSGPEKSGYTYYFQTPAHPDFKIAVNVPDLAGGEAIDDYAIQLLSYYAKQYDLSCGVVKKKATLFYPDIQDIENFCDTMLQMFEEQEELQVLPEIGICPENIIFKEVMIDGGVYGFSYPEKQVYQVAELIDDYESNYLVAQILEAYIFYLFNYEAWNLTDGQYINFGPIYEELCKDASFEGGEWCNLYNEEDKVCDLYLPYYSVPEFSDVYKDLKVGSVRMMTVGNVYHRLQMLGASITINEDGSGFCVENDGKIDLYGQGCGIAIKFYDLGWFY